MAINSDGRGDNKESAAALSRKEIKRGVLGAELQKSVDEPTLCNRQVLVFLPPVPLLFSSANSGCTRTAHLPGMLLPSHGSSLSLYAT